MRSNVVPLNQEREFQLSELLFSTTNKKGIIQSGNDAFVRVSGYQFTELLGQPHNILRHPDMPRAVFKLLWDYLAAGKSIIAYVKNMAKDGRYYWVVALVTPLHDGYFSIRFKPSTALLDEIKALYEKLLAEENELLKAGQTPKEAMTAATLSLQAAIQAKGFATYDEFMHFLLRTELGNREAVLQQQASNKIMNGINSVPATAQVPETELLLHIIAQSNAIAEALKNLFAKLGDLVVMGDTLEEKVEFISQLSLAMRVLSLNTGIASSHLQINSEVFNSIAKLMVENSNTLNTHAQRMSGHLLQTSDVLKRIVYDLGSACLQLEMLRQFLGELQTQRPEQALANANASDRNSSVARILTLQDIFSQTYKRGIEAFQKIEADLAILLRDKDDLQHAVQTLQFVHLVSRVEISRDAQLSGFGNILTEVLNKIKDTKGHLTELSDTVLSLARETAGLGKIDSRVAGFLRQIQQDTELLEKKMSRKAA